MKKQLIISVGREYGSGGHYIAKQLAERFGLPIYDHDMLDHIGEAKGMDLSHMKKYDEGMKKPFFYKTVRGISNSPEQALAEMQFQFLKDKAKSGESFVVVGRCGEEVLRDFEGLVSIFVRGEREQKVERIMEVRKMTKREARKAIERHDRERKAYHNHYCKKKWGDSRNYDLCINSSRFGLEATTDILEDYIKHAVTEEE